MEIILQLEEYVEDWDVIRKVKNRTVCEDVSVLSPEALEGALTI